MELKDTQKKKDQKQYYEKVNRYKLLCLNLRRRYVRIIRE